VGTNQRMAWLHHSAVFVRSLCERQQKCDGVDPCSFCLAAICLLNAMAMVYIQQQLERQTSQDRTSLLAKLDEDLLLVECL
jgi:hypothetical protein